MVVTTIMRAMTETVDRRGLYPAIEPHRTGRLDVGDGHELYYEESGNSAGKPVVFLHGGPGAGCSPKMRRFFDPGAYRILLFDQRGCGRSTPHASLEHNTTRDLVNDIEHLRESLQIDRWQVFGGSWGSTLALAYAEVHPDRVEELVLRGIFTIRQKELDWLYRKGTSELFPDRWQQFIEPIAPEDRGDLLRAYHALLTGDDSEARLRAAKAWSIWEGSTIMLVPDDKTIAEFGADDMALAVARIECHYFVNGGFMEEGQLLTNIDRIRDIPAVIVHGRYGALCPARNAWELAQAWPEASLRLVDDAGHSAFEAGIVHELVTATDAFAAR